MPYLVSGSEYSEITGEGVVRLVLYAHNRFVGVNFFVSLHERQVFFKCRDAFSGGMCLL